MRKALALAVLVLAALVGSQGIASAHGNESKWWVCKYVGTPFVDERLQTGQNPISVDDSAIEQDPVQVGSYFQDQHGRSYVLAADTGQEEPDVSECPAPAGPTTTTQPEVTTTTAPTTTAPETTTSSPDTTPTTTAPCTEPRGCPPPPQPTNPDGSLRLGGPDGPDGAAPLPFTGSSTGTLAWAGAALVALGLALQRRPRITNQGSDNE